MIRSNPACLYNSIAPVSAALVLLFDALVARLRIYTRSVSILFIRMRSPSKAPPLLILDGSTEIIPMVISSNSVRKRNTISSVSELFPAPPVPVIPSTGIVFSDFALSGFPSFFKSCLSEKLINSSFPFSSAVIALAIAFGSLSSTFSISISVFVTGS